MEIDVNSYERFEFAREGRILRVTLAGSGPANAVDEIMHREFPRLLHKTVDGVILYTTTEPGEAMQLGDEMIVMHEGRIIAHGDPGDLFDAPPMSRWRS